MNYLARDHMIKINFQEPDTDNWHKWRDQCDVEQKKHNEAIEAHQSSKVKGDVYKGKQYNIKTDIYMNLHGPFHGKCVYCESLMITDQHGDMEHFRPKKAISDINFNTVRIEIDGETRDHPGYYWLCYDFKNLLPACIKCNRKSNIVIEGKKIPIGKDTRFPVKGTYARRPGEEDKEEPLLINPVFDDENPEKHLELDLTGLFNPRNQSPRGRACINIFGLNLREELVDARKEVYEATKVQVKMWLLASAYESQEAAKHYAYLMDIKLGKKSYSAAGRLALEKVAPDIEMKLQTLRN